MFISKRLVGFSVKPFKHLNARTRAQPFWQPESTFTFVLFRPKLKQAFRQEVKASFFHLRYKNIHNMIGNMAQTQNEEFKRLPINVRPVNYEVELKPNLKAFTFEGKEAISVEVLEGTQTIQVNSAEIEISDVTYKPDEGVEMRGTSVLNEKTETATFTFPEVLKVGSGTLGIKFTGCLNDKMKGFYRSKYITPTGEERYGAVTQFEASDARRAFPCWDEPAIKATFDVTLIAPKEKVALSNMPVKSETEDPDDSNLKVVKYQRSPIMSTYLLAFIVGEYDYVEDKDADGVLIRVYTPVGKKEQGKFALDVTVKTLPFYKSYFNIAYPLPKMDLIAIADFSAGAMENWGLVTYRETALLVDPENSSAKSKQWIALVVGHEMAHQWFGNLVTMEWWTNLWLNEGFASWIEYLCVDHIHPEFEIWTQFVVQDLGRALELDGLHTSHPIEVPVGSPAEIDEIFDAISYSKGASVIRMLHDYIGDKDFRVGMNDYLTKFEYKNTKTEDLWECLEKASGKPVAKVMNTWTKQMGFPVISVSEKQDGDNRVLELSQEKFNSDGQVREGESKEWLVPVSISTSADPSNPVQTILLDQPNMSVAVPNTPKGTWAKINPGAVGVYRVRYSSEMLDTLIPGIKDKSLPPRDRLALQNDLFALSRAGLMPAVDVMKVAEGYVNEEDYTVWSDLSLNLGVIAQMIQYTDAYDWYKNYAKSIYGPICKKLGWTIASGEGVLTSMLRDLVLTKMGRYGDPDVVEEARKRFEEHCEGNALPADLRQSVYVTVLANGDEEIFNKMLKLYDESDLQEEKVRIARMLGGIKDIKLKEKVLQFAMSEKVRSQDTVFVIGGVAGSKEGRDLSWQFVQDNWSVLYERYSGGFLLPRLIKLVIEGFASEEKAKEIEEFFMKNPAPVADRAIKQSLENIHLNANWMKNESADVSTFLKDRPAA